MLTPYHAKYFANDLTKRYSSNNVEKFTASLANAQVDLNPHQVDAALFAFQSPLSRGAILADEVGLGKTIEAGILLSQKWAERKRKILIIVPANLRKQWSQELADKFFLPSAILEAGTFNEQIKKGNLNPFIQSGLVICSYQFARAKEAYLRNVAWDLVVIDEAHRLRNVYKASNRIGRSIKESLANVHKVLLTATPLQNSLLELFGLVSIIDDYTFGDLKSFKAQFARLSEDDNFDELKRRLEPVCKRTLRRQVLEYINYRNRIAITQDFTPGDDEQRLYDQVSGYLQRDTLYALPAGQRQLMTLILRKLLASSTYAISGTLTSLITRLEATLLQQAELTTLPDDVVADNFEALDEYKDDFTEETEADEEEEPVILTPEQLAEIEAEIKSLNEFRELAESIRKNSKGEALITALHRGFEKLGELGANRKAIIFTESKRTQTYLKQNLEANGYAGQIVLFNGSNSDPDSQRIYKGWAKKYANTDHITGSKSADMRAALVEHFRDTATVMIATEAAAEGINLQFCSLVVNYDLPWNPQRIEQRIGRCHRYGQKHDVVVVNFLNRANAADVRVFNLLESKFRLFDGVFGASDEVLGSIESGVDFEKRIAQIFQQCRTETEIQTAFDDLQRDLQPGIAEQMRQTKKKLLENFDEEVHEKLRVVHQTTQTYLNKYEQRLWDLTQYALANYAEFDDHSFTLRENPFPGEAIHPGPYRVSERTAERLITNQVEEPGVDSPVNLYRVGHPLAQRILKQCMEQNLPVAALDFDYAHAPVKVSILENLPCQTGWLRVQKLIVAAGDTEDHLLLAGVCDDGTPLEPDQCQRLFSIPATVTNPRLSGNDLLGLNGAEAALAQTIHSQQITIVDDIGRRNGEYFDDELDKLDKWADDLKNSLTTELKDLEKDIKFRRTEARKLLNLDQKIKEQRVIKDLEKRLADKRMNLYKAQDDIDQRKEKLLDDTQERLKQHIQQHELFTIRWSIS